MIGVGARADFGGACFFAAAGGSLGAAAGAVACLGAPARGGAAEPGAPGSGVMMLTGGGDAAEG